MATILFPSPIFGPVHSRRLGVSLGINLMPADGKICTFDCIYCECGFNRNNKPQQHRPTRETVASELEKKLQTMTAEGKLPDVLTFAGNGEPTTHPDFAGIIDDTIALRNRYCPTAKVSVLSNATRIAVPEVHAALLRVDNNILKLDTVSASYIDRINRPCGTYDIENVIENLCTFNGRLIIQTIFMKGTDATGTSVDNTGEEYVRPWLEAVRRIAPRQVMIYTIDRETPDSHLQKALPEELDDIADRIKALDIATSVSY